MADSITVKHEQSKGFEPTPEGSQQAVCVDVIDLGERTDTFPGQDTRLVHKVAIVFQVADVNAETGKRFDIAAEFTLSMNEKAALRKFLSQWRGKDYSEAEAEAGVPLDKLVGANAIISVVHKISKGKGRKYGIVSAVTPLLKGMGKIAAEGYERGAYWDTRKAEYAAGVTAYRASIAALAEPPHPADSFDGIPEALDDDTDPDSLPF